MNRKQQRYSLKNKEGQRRKPDVLVVVLTVLLIAALVVVLFLCLKNRNGNKPDGTDTTVIGGGDPIPEDEGKSKDIDFTHLPAYGELTFTAGTKEQSVKLRNPGENTCLIRISLILADGTAIYQSELTKPGYYTKPITLTSPMERGIYKDVTIKYECFTDDENQTPLNGATSKLDITVK